MTKLLKLRLVRAFLITAVIMGGVGTILGSNQSNVVNNPACFSGWCPETSPTHESFRGIWGSALDNIYVVGGDDLGLNGLATPDRVIRFDGTSWATALPNTSAWMDVFGFGTTDVFVVGKPRSTFAPAVAHFDGSSWTSGATPPTSLPLNGTWGSSPNSVFAVGDGGAIVQSTDRAATWISRTSGVTTRLFDVWGAGISPIIAVGASQGGVATVLRSTDGGTTWTKITNGIPNANLHGVWGADALHFTAVGDNSTIIRSADGGLSWTAQATSSLGLPNLVLLDVGGSSANDLFAVGYITTGPAGVILRFDGATWKDQSGTSTTSSGTVTTRIANPLQAVWTLPGSCTDAIAVGLTGTLLRKHRTSCT